MLDYLAIGRMYMTNTRIT
ncbi:hypothetical protein F383_17625 [Gossypium arboreum]|uniref:Uncharacterized protein n=1 Tax=Gossypium arboreum TaxID=29729 RepID=A0A0B0NVD9_GOSAR|nr:hypothetical protein F383_17625 [Gossypium arboreum]